MRNRNTRLPRGRRRARSRRNHGACALVIARTDARRLASASGGSLRILSRQRSATRARSVRRSTVTATSILRRNLKAACPCNGLFCNGCNQSKLPTNTIVLGDTREDSDTLLPSNNHLGSNRGANKDGHRGHCSKRRMRRYIQSRYQGTHREGVVCCKQEQDGSMYTVVGWGERPERKAAPGKPSKSH